MKTKRFDKKLFLNKETVSHLNNLEMAGVEGGAPGETLIYYPKTGCPCITQFEICTGDTGCTTTAC